MAEPSVTQRLHIVEGTEWKDAEIKLLEPRSPYRPWRHGSGEFHEGDPVAVVRRRDRDALSISISIQSDTTRWNAAPLPWLAPASVMTLACGASASVTVDLPASG